MKEFMCIQKCPEIEGTGYGHCRDTEKGIQEREERFGDYCPCGNIAKWQELDIEE